MLLNSSSFSPCPTAVAPDCKFINGYFKSALSARLKTYSTCSLSKAPLKTSLNDLPSAPRRKQVDELPSKNQALCAFCVTCIVLLCVNLLYSLCKLNHC